MGRALVLGGGGIAGIAWEVGLLTGLRRAGVDLTTADTVIGTSAGSVVGATVAAGVDLESAIAEQRFNYDGTGERFNFEVLVEVFSTMADMTLDPHERTLRVAKLALAAPVVDEERYLERFQRRLAALDWPADRRLVITGVDTATGELAAWERGAGVPLAAAVAASCAVPGVYPPVTIDGRRFMDGGIRSGTNADLAAGASIVVVVAPMARLSPHGAPPEELAALDAQTLVIAPDDAAMEAFGPNVLAASAAEPSLAAGLAQGAGLVEAVRRVWP